MKNLRQKSAILFRRFARGAWVFLLWATGQLFRAKKRFQQSNNVLVLMLHRVLDHEAALKTCSQPEIVLLQPTFERMVRYMISEFEIVDLSQGSGYPTGAATRPRLAITFDDGWSDNYAAGLSTAAAGLKFCIFLCPQRMGKTLPFWPETVAAGMRAQEPNVSKERIATVIERLKAMPVSERDGYISKLGSPRSNSVDATFGWAEALEMQSAGVHFGSHTSTHQMLTKIPPVDALREILDSRGAIRARLGQPCVLFAYPNGDVSPKVREMVKDAGYRQAFTTQPGFWNAATDLFRIPRTNVYEEKVTGFFGRFSRSMFDYSLIFKSAIPKPSAFDRSSTH